MTKYFVSAARLTLLCLFGLAASVCGAPDWKTETIEDRPYVALADVVAAYGMKASEKREDPKELGFKGEKHSLIVKLDSRQTIIEGVRHWLSFPVVQPRGGRPMISLVDVKSTITPVFEPAAAAESIGKVKTVVFDPGHGGVDPGAVGSLGYEKNYVLDIVKRTRRILEGRGVKVVQSRLSDFYVKLSERPAMTKNYEDPIFISIHLNGSTNRKASGIEVFTMTPAGAPPNGRAPHAKSDAEAQPNTPFEPAGFLLANTVYQHLIGKSDAFDRGVKRSRFTVLRVAKAPAILIEGAFLTNHAEAQKIHTSEWRENYATRLADGIQAYMNLANEKVAPQRAIDLDRKPTDEFVPE